MHEPIDYWYAIDRQTDYLDFFGGRGRGFLAASDVTPEAQKRFRRLFGQSQKWSGKSHVLEKYPADGLRIDWLNALVPGAKFLHIIRDGRAVCRSIQAISAKNDYLFLGKPKLHQWWGHDFHKWDTLVRECRERAILTPQFQLADAAEPRNFGAMAALEWLVRIRTIRADVERLGLGSDRFLEVRYDRLVADPVGHLRMIEDFMGAPRDEAKEQFAREFLVARADRQNELRLPELIFREFAAEQKLLGYPVDGVVVE